MAEATPALEIRNLHKRYGDLEVLKGISLTARDGDVISILGSSGSGKSTFLRCINLLENPHQGQIIIAGEELKLKPSKNGDLVAADSRQINRMRSEIGFVFQNFNLWPHMSVLDNIIEAPLRWISSATDLSDGRTCTSFRLSLASFMACASRCGLRCTNSRTVTTPAAIRGSGAGCRSDR